MKAKSQRDIIQKLEAEKEEGLVLIKQALKDLEEKDKLIAELSNK